MVFPVLMYGCESWTIKKTEWQRIDAFEVWCWRSLLRVTWRARRSNQSILKKINPEYSLEGLMLKLKLQYFGSVQFSSVAQSCQTLCNPMNRSTPGLPVHHQLLEPIQTHVHLLVMPPNHLILCHPLLLLPSIFPSIRVFSNESVLCIRWPNIGVSASASVLPMNIQDWFPLGWIGWISSQSKGLSRVFSNTTVHKHQLFSAQLSLQSNSHIHTWLLKKP